MLTGSCLCGGAAYEVDAAPGPIEHCHCRTCRKAHGAAFSTVMPIPRDRFYWTRGDEQLGTCESSSGKFRRFCTKCGSQIFAERPGRPNVLLRPGCLDAPITKTSPIHIWRPHGASWFDPNDRLTEIPEAPF